MIYIHRIVGDNLDFEVHARVQSKSHVNQSIHWTHQYGIKDKVVDRTLEASRRQKSVSNIQLSNLLPDEATCLRLQKRWTMLVSRVVTTYLKEFQFLSNHVLWHIPHKYSTQMAQKSDVVSMMHMCLHFMQAHCTTLHILFYCSVHLTWNL